MGLDPEKITMSEISDDGIVKITVGTTSDLAYVTSTGDALNIDGTDYYRFSNGMWYSKEDLANAEEIKTDSSGRISIRQGELTSAGYSFTDNDHVYIDGNNGGTPEATLEKQMLGSNLFDVAKTVHPTAVGLSANNNSNSGGETENNNTPTYTKYKTSGDKVTFQNTIYRWSDEDQGLMSTPVNSLVTEWTYYPDKKLYVLVNGSKVPYQRLTATHPNNAKELLYVSSAEWEAAVLSGNMIGFNTGGYTGDWDSSGRLALLHQKEIVLNAHDTENFLSAIDILRDITKVIDLQALAQSNMLSSMTAATVGAHSQVIEQEVTIHAEFPNATNHNEIEEAFNTLLNRASQFANRKN